ncbi:MAG: hypothetical protein WEB58_12275 [Planctomycetaceae bacterium]
MSRYLFISSLLFLVAATSLPGCTDQASIDKATSQVRRLTEELDKQTTATGVYVRAKEGDAAENDPWGTPLNISYSQGGVSETITVRSAGPDKLLHTDDDILQQGMAMNFKGIGEGIKQNAGETAKNLAKGAVKGAVEGVKESIKDSLPFKRKQKGNDAAGVVQDQAEDVKTEEENNEE